MTTLVRESRLPVYLSLFASVGTLGVVFDHAAIPAGFFVIGGIAAAGLAVSARLKTA